MEDRNQTPDNNYRDNWPAPRGGSSGKVMAGLLLIAVGLVVLATKLNLFFLPHWVFSWQMFLIVLGLFIGFRHNFRKSSWLVLVLIGGVFLVNDMFTGFNMRFYFWPVLLIAIGLWVMLKPRHRFDSFSRRHGGSSGPQPTGYHNGPDNADSTSDTTYSTEEVVEATAILGGVKKNIISKNFRGGEIVSVFGGSELNLSQADLQKPAVLETTQIFGGTTLIVPPHWHVISEVAAILGGVDDKRPIMPGSSYDPNKVLILKGTALFGGLSIKSY